MDNVDGGKCEVKRRAGEVMRSKLGPPRVTNVPQIFGSKVRHEAPYDEELARSSTELGERREVLDSNGDRRRRGLPELLRTVVCWQNVAPL